MIDAPRAQSEFGRRRDGGSDEEVVYPHYRPTQCRAGKIFSQELREFSTVSACRIATDDGLAPDAASEVEAANKMNRNVRPISTF